MDPTFKRKCCTQLAAHLIQEKQLSKLIQSQKNRSNHSRKKQYVCFCGKKLKSMNKIKHHLYQMHPNSYQQYGKNIKQNMICSLHTTQKYQIYTLLEKQRVTESQIQQMRVQEDESSEMPISLIGKENLTSDRYECFCGLQFFTMTGLAGYHFRKHHTQLYRHYKMRLTQLIQTQTTAYLFIFPFLLMYQSSILIMLSIVRRRPLFTTDIAELIPTPTCHVIAALIFFDYKITPLALPVVQVLLKEKQLFAVTVSLVLLKHALTAELLPALVAQQ